MIDFSSSIYKKLVMALMKNDYQFCTLLACHLYKGRLIVLRHDVDRNPQNSLLMAIIENELGIKGTYYFRGVKCSYNEKIIKKIVNLGHEIGYHYEELNTVYNRIKKCRGRLISENDLIDQAYELFCNNLAKMRKIVTINTICMHGCPLCPLDNRVIWKKYNYRDLGIVKEPYFDMNWNIWGYMTDTGRRWDAKNSNIRDKVESKINLEFKKTHDIINNIDKLPEKIMITIHPQRWTNEPVPWLKEIIYQNIKNKVKEFIIRQHSPV